MTKKLQSKNAYFVAPLFAKSKLGNIYKEVSEILQNNGFEVHDDVNKVSADDAKNMSDQEIAKYFTQVEKLIRQTDIFVAELTEPSPSVGYEIGYAIANSKPILILRDENAEGTLGAPFRANANKLITIVKYNEDNLEHEIGKFLRKAERGIFVKRLPIEFTENQVNFVNDLQSKYSQRSFNSTVRLIIDRAISDGLL
jgi:nucleoside 2-deoxyribosyltransferase